LVCDRIRAIILARSLASRLSIVAALIATSKAAFRLSGRARYRGA